MRRVKQQLPRVGLIGTGGFARIHAELLLMECTQERLKLVAAVIPPAEQELEMAGRIRASGARIYPDYVSFMRSEAGRIDLCCIPTGIPWHARMSIAALEAEMNVLVEKPLAGCVADAQAIREAEQRTGHWVAVAYQDYYTDTVHWLRDELASGTIGKLECIKFLVLWPRPRNYYRRNDWSGRLRLGQIEVRDTPLNNAFSHYVNLALYFAAAERQGDKQPRIIEAEYLRTHTVETHDTVVVRAMVEDGPRFWFGGSQACTTVRDPEIILTGTRGSACWSQVEGCCWICPAGEKAVQKPVPGGDEARRLMLASVLERIRTGQGRICGTEVAIRPTSLIEALEPFSNPTLVPTGKILEAVVPGFSEPIPAMENIDTRLIEAFKRECLLQKVQIRRDDSATPPIIPQAKPLPNPTSPDVL